MIATLTFPEGISISEFIDALTFYFSTFEVDMSGSPVVRTSTSHPSCIVHENIHQANGITVTIQQHINPDAVVVQKARCVEKWCGQGNWFDITLIQADRAPQNNSWVRQQGYCPAKLLKAFRLSDRINTGEVNANQSVPWRTVHHNLLLVQDLEYLSSAMTNRTNGMIMCRDAPQRVRGIVDVSSVLTPVQLVLSGENNQYLLNQYASLESYNMIYYMARICWSHHGCLVSRANSCQCRLLHLVRARVQVRVALVSHIYRSRDCQIRSELTSQSYVN